MVSRHRDGEIIARIVERLGYLHRPRQRHSWRCRGAQRNAQEPSRRTRSCPDRGWPRAAPRGIIKPGVIYAAARTGCPIVPVTCGYFEKESVRQLGWFFQLPIPFGEMHYVCGEPIHVPPSPTPEEVEIISRKLSDNLNFIGQFERQSLRSDRIPGTSAQCGITKVYYPKENLSPTMAAAGFLSAVRVPSIAWAGLSAKACIRQISFTARNPTCRLSAREVSLLAARGKTPVAALIVERLMVRGTQGLPDYPRLRPK